MQVVEGGMGRSGCGGLDERYTISTAFVQGVSMAMMLHLVCPSLNSAFKEDSVEARTARANSLGSLLSQTTVPSMMSTSLPVTRTRIKPRLWVICAVLTKTGVRYGTSVS